MASNVEKEALQLIDKILQNARAADAAIVILQQKLLKLRQCDLVSCKPLKVEIEDTCKSLDPVYQFLTKNPKPEEKKEWKSELLEAVYKMEDGIDKFRFRIALQGSSNANQCIKISRLNMLRTLFAKCLLGRCLKEFKIRMTSLKETEYITDKPSDSVSDKERAPQMHDPRDWDGLFSLDLSGNVMAARESIMNELINKFIEPQDGPIKIKMIVGEEGSGKTFLARSIFIQQRHNFDCCAWVNISGMTEPGDVGRSLLKKVSEVPPSSSPWMELLCKELFEKRFLIVFDDVRDFSLISDVLWILPETYSGGRVLITTQERPFRFDPSATELMQLKDDESEELIKSKSKIAGIDLEGTMKHHEWLKELFLKKCRGSPLRLNLLLGLAANSKHPDQIITAIPDTDDLDQIFTYCYNKMRGKLKPCFLYMTLFPKDDSIPVRRLLRLWLSEGLLVVPNEAEMEPEDLGLDYLKELIFRNLIEAVEWKEDGSPRRVRVVPCLYDLFHLGAIGSELLYVNTPKKSVEGQPPGDQHHQAASRLRWLVERSNIKELSLSPVAKINHVRTFLSFNWREGKLTQDIGDFLEMTVSGTTINLLTVLDLEGVYKPNLDKVLGKLVLLKHLGLRSTALDSLPKSVADLPYLETFDLKHTNITELPKSFWKKSRNLRHLYLNGCCRIDEDTFSSSSAIGTSTKQPFANLHTFSGVVVDSFKVKTAANTGKHTIVGLSNMKKLTKLGIMFQDNKEKRKAIGDWISSLTNLQSLKLGIIKSGKPSVLPEQLSFTQHFNLSQLYLLGEFHDSSIHLMHQNLVTLTLSGSKMKMDHVIQLGDLPNLKVLNLKADSFVGETLKLSKGCLQNLQVLRLWKLQKIKTLDLENTLPKIKVIEFRDCPTMEEIKGIRDVGKAREGKVLLQLMVGMSDTFVDKIREEVRKDVAEVPKVIIKAKKKVPDPKLKNEEAPREN